MGAFAAQTVVALLQIYLLYLTKPIIDMGVLQKDLVVVLGFATIMVLLAAGILLVALSVAVLSASLASYVGSSMRQDIYDRVMSMSTPGERTRDASDALVRMSADVNAAQEYTRLLVSTVLFVPSMMFLMLWMVSEISMWAAAAMLFSFLGVMAFMVYSGRRVRYMVVDVQTRMDGLTAMFRDSVAGARAIRAYGRTEHEMARFSKDHAVFVKRNTKFCNNTFFYPLLAVAAINFALVMVYNRGGITVGDFDMTTSELSLVVQLWGCLLGCLSVVPFITTVSPKYAVGKRRILEILGAPAKEAQAPEPSGDGDAIVFESTTLGVGGKPVVEGLDISVRRGETVAMVGLEGPLRRSIVAAIAGIRPPTEGRVLVDGVTVAGPEDARGSLSIVSDRVMILRDTVRENIAMGSVMSDEALGAVCADACLEDVLEKLAEGVDTDLSSRGQELSDGQRQRIVIARALAKPAGIRVFDECFYSIDPSVESQLVRNIAARCEGDTVVFIAGGIHQAALADRVLFFDDGRLVAEGTHEGLMASCPSYAALRRIQGGARWMRDSRSMCCTWWPSRSRPTAASTWNSRS